MVVGLTIVGLPSAAQASAPTWTSVGDMRVPRAFAGLVVLHDGSVLVAGGFVVNAYPFTVTDTAEIFRTAAQAASTCRWSRIGGFITA